MKEIILPADSNELNNLFDFIRNSLNSLKVFESLIIHLELAVEEIFINIVNHAFKDSDLEDRNIHVIIEVERDPLKIMITFEDKGIPFNPLKVLDPDILLDADQRKIGGLGIFIIKKMWMKCIINMRMGKIF
ncbi:MAG: ATP-binding protein [Methanobrevibacter sp.]|jgi:anti-sigma regulatory factor (Ser/Thr protein kinase)|nr:ATP-binding protein [Candidatus Methanovirga meridionalis]